jgi:hypothetical protein
VTVELDDVRATREEEILKHDQELRQQLKLSNESVAAKKVNA